jgi:hypothetical protein
MKPKPAGRKDDPQPYDGPIERADGVRPWNMYLWPTESWWPGHAPQLRRSISGGRFHFGYVALKDGRFSTEGHVYEIERNADLDGLPCVFATRVQAIRASAARMIRLMRAARCWKGPDRVDDDTLEVVVNWTLKAVAQATDVPPPDVITVRRTPPEPPVGVESGLPLWENARKARGGK